MTSKNFLKDVAINMLSHKQWAENKDFIQDFLSIHNISLHSFYEDKPMWSKLKFLDDPNYLEFFKTLGIDPTHTQLKSSAFYSEKIKSNFILHYFNSAGLDSDRAPTIPQIYENTFHYMNLYPSLLDEDCSYVSDFLSSKNHILKMNTLDRIVTSGIIEHLTVFTDTFPNLSHENQQKIQQTLIKPTMLQLVNDVCFQNFWATDFKISQTRLMERMDCFSKMMSPEYKLKLDIYKSIETEINCPNISNFAKKYHFLKTSNYIVPDTQKDNAIVEKIVDHFFNPPGSKLLRQMVKSQNKVELLLKFLEEYEQNKALLPEGHEQTFLKSVKKNIYQENMSPHIKTALQFNFEGKQKLESWLLMLDLSDKEYEGAAPKKRGYL